MRPHGTNNSWTEKIHGMNICSKLHRFHNYITDVTPLMMHQPLSRDISTGGAPVRAATRQVTEDKEGAPLLCTSKCPDSQSPAWSRPYLNIPSLQSSGERIRCSGCALHISHPQVCKAFMDGVRKRWSLMGSRSLQLLTSTRALWAQFPPALEHPGREPSAAPSTNPAPGPQVWHKVWHAQKCSCSCLIGKNLHPGLQSTGVKNKLKKNPTKPNPLSSP